MNIFELFKSSPFVNMHEVNLDWILSKMKECLNKTDTAIKTATDIKESIDSLRANLDGEILRVSSDEEMRSSLMNLFNEMPESTGRKFTVVPYNGYENTAKPLLCEFHKFSNNGILDMQFWEDGCVYKQTAMVQDGALTEFEWVNPPYKANEIYRTTERFKGYPLYAVNIACGMAVHGDNQVTLSAGIVGDPEFETCHNEWTVISCYGSVCDGFYNGMDGNAVVKTGDYPIWSAFSSIKAMWSANGLTLNFSYKDNSFANTMEGDTYITVKFIKKENYEGGC